MNFMLRLKEFLIIKKYQLKALFYKHQSNPVLFIFIGIPCSGKTTISKMIAHRLSALRISTDDIKLFLYNEKKYDINNIFRVQHIIIKKLSTKKINLISDANSSKIVYREALKKLLYNNSYRTIQIYCYADENTIWQRMLERSLFISTKEQLKAYTDELEISSDVLYVDTNKMTLQQILIKVEEEYEGK